jgi:aspartokinase
MLKITDAVLDLISRNSFLQMGLSHRLLNITQLAKFLRPLVEARVKKDVQASAIAMALSRKQRELEAEQVEAESPFKVDNITVHSDLFAVTYAKSKDIHRVVNEIYNKIQRRGGYITITEGVNEITLIVESGFASYIADTVSDTPVSEHRSVASLGIKFNVRYLNIPGFFYRVFQQLYFQKVNLLEIASTATELILYIDQADVRLAFDTLYNCFDLREQRVFY